MIVVGQLSPSRMSGDIGFDTVLDLCRDQHRRIVLGTLTEQEQSLTVDDLTEAIFEYNHHTPISEASGDEITEIQISLFHVHLPMLASNGLVEYDQERQIVEPTEELEEVQPTVSTILDADPSFQGPIEL